MIGIGQGHRDRRENFRYVGQRPRRVPNAAFCAKNASDVGIFWSEYLYHSVGAWLPVPARELRSRYRCLISRAEEAIAVGRVLLGSAVARERRALELARRRADRIKSD